jgi:hypothetical protein
LRPEAPNRKLAPMRGREQVVVLMLKKRIGIGL